MDDMFAKPVNPIVLSVGLQHFANIFSKIPVLVVNNSPAKIRTHSLYFYIFEFVNRNSNRLQIEILKIFV